MPNCFFTAWGSKLVLCGTLIALVAPFNAMAKVLLQTTRIVVGVAAIDKTRWQTGEVSVWWDLVALRWFVELQGGVLMTEKTVFADGQISRQQTFNV